MPNKDKAAWYMKRYRDQVESKRRKEDDYWASLNGPVKITRIKPKDKLWQK